MTDQMELPLKVNMIINIIHLLNFNFFDWTDTFKIINI